MDALLRIGVSLLPLAGDRLVQLTFHSSSSRQTREPALAIAPASKKTVDGVVATTSTFTSPYFSSRYFDDQTYSTRPRRC